MTRVIVICLSIASYTYLVINIINIEGKTTFNTYFSIIKRFIIRTIINIRVILKFILTDVFIFCCSQGLKILSDFYIGFCIRIIYFSLRGFLTEFGLDIKLIRAFNAINSIIVRGIFKTIRIIF